MLVMKITFTVISSMFFIKQNVVGIEITPGGYSPEDTRPPFSIQAYVSGVAKTPIFVDKTEIIKAFFQYKKVVMLYAPRRFGKTINMDLIRKFCELPVNVNGTRISRESTKNYNFFANNNLSIYKDKEFFSTHFGRYPVIFLDFKNVNFNASYLSFVRAFKTVLKEAYTSHKYLLNSTKVDKGKKILFEECYDDKDLTKLDDDELYNSIAILSYLLHIHFYTKSIILIDNFDAPVQQAFWKTGYWKMIPKVTEFLFNFMYYTFDGNRYVERTLINSCLKLGPLPINGTEEMRFSISNTFSPFYGYTEQEILRITKKLNIPNIDMVRKWYDGYDILNSTIKVYNPLSLTFYLLTKELNEYWVDAIENARLLRKLFSQKEIGDKILKILSHNSTTIQYFDELSANNTFRLKHIIRSPEKINITERDVDLYLQFMTDQGYFKIVSTNSIRKEVEITIPNFEIKQDVMSLLVNKTQIL